VIAVQHSAWNQIEFRSKSFTPSGFLIPKESSRAIALLQMQRGSRLSMTIGKISAAPLRRAALLGALLSASVAGVALAQDQVSSPAGVSVAADTVSQLQAATTPEQVTDIIAVASINMTPDQIAALVAAAVAAHPNFATSIVSAAAAAHPEAVNQIAAAAVAALPVGQQADAAAAIVAAAAGGAGVSLSSVANSVAATNGNVGSGGALASAAANAGPLQLAGITPAGISNRDSLASFTPTAGVDAPLSATDTTTVTPDTTAPEPPASDPSKGNSGSPT
jgi:hypothetical protein